MNLFKLSSLIFVFAMSSYGATIGSAADAFSLKALSGKTHALKDFAGKTVVLEWYNPGCPYVKKHYESANMQSLQSTYTSKDVVWLSVASGKTVKELKKDKSSKATAVLLDADGKIGKAYGASTTPHMFIINAKGILVYQGAIDGNDSADAKTIKDAEKLFANALDLTLEGKEIPKDKANTKPYGCSVKY